MELFLLCCELLVPTGASGRSLCWRCILAAPLGDRLTESVPCPHQAYQRGKPFCKRVFPHGKDAVGVRPRCGKDAAPQANAVKHPFLKLLGVRFAHKFSFFSLRSYFVYFYMGFSIKNPKKTLVDWFRGSTFRLNRLFFGDS